MQHMKRSDDLVSVIIPIYNYAHFLPAALESVLAQKGVELEVIAVDDGSTDATRRVLDKYRGRARRRIHVLHQDNLGLSAARNAGIDLAHGEFLVFLDADDILLRNTLSSQRDMFCAYSDLNMSVCRSFFFENTDRHGNPIRTGQWRLFRQDLDIHLCHFNIAPPHALMIRRSLVDRLGGFDTGLTACEDHDLWFRAVSQYAKLVANPKAVVAYRRHPTSMSCDTGNQLRHDAILHERIGRCVEEDVSFPPEGRLEGLTAHIAGCLTTAGRLEEVDPEISGMLRSRAMSATDILRREAPPPMRCPETLLYFLRRVFMSLQAPIEKKESWAEKMNDHFRQLFPGNCPEPGLPAGAYRHLVEASARRLTESPFPA